MYKVDIHIAQRRGGPIAFLRNSGPDDASRSVILASVRLTPHVTTVRQASAPSRTSDRVHGAT